MRNDSTPLRNVYTVLRTVSTPSRIVSTVPRIVSTVPRIVSTAPRIVSTVPRIVSTALWGHLPLLTLLQRPPVFSRSVAGLMRGSCQLAFLYVTGLLILSGSALGQDRVLEQAPPSLPERHLPETTSVARIALANIGLTGSFALVRGWLTGNVDDRGDAVEIFLGGGLGGYGFYQAKRLIGNEHAFAGLALAYTSASVVENAAQGRHPLSHLRFGPGPVDLRVRTPFAEPDAPFATVEVNILSAAGALVLPVLGYKPSFRNGKLYFRTNDFINQEGRVRTVARTINRTPLLGPDPSEYTWEHELIHVVQSLQVGATTPYYRLSSLYPSPSYSLGGTEHLKWDLQIDWLYGTLVLSQLAVDYEQRWAEVEAYSLTEPEAPPSWECPPGTICLFR